MSGSSKETASTSTSSTPLSREERFKALRSKLVASTKANHAEVIAEHKRMKIDPVSLSKLEHKKADAELKLSKQDAEEAGDDFERKRAWDWTMEESEKWDRRLAQKAQNRDQAGFAGIAKSCILCVLTFPDYTQIAEKSYRQDLKGLKPDLEVYKKAKEEALSKGQIVDQNGELVVLDEDGRFYANANSLGVMEHKPTKDAVDRLVAETQKREADKEAKRRKKRAGEDGDVSYINKRNKVFNEKLSRHVPDGEYSSDFAIGSMISILEKHGRHLSEGVVCSRQHSGFFDTRIQSIHCGDSFPTIFLNVYSQSIKRD
jgi:pre-mRNA-splicing factor SYF2